MYALQFVTLLIYYRCKQWMEKCQTEHLLKKDATILYKNYRVCGVHFEDKMFLNPNSRNRLTMNAVPTIFSGKILFIIINIFKTK